jgi:hypothetical protein
VPLFREVSIFSVLMLRYATCTYINANELKNYFSESDEVENFMESGYWVPPPLLVKVSRKGLSTNL